NGPVYVGALIFSLFLLGAVIVRGPMKWALLLLTVFSIVLAWGRHAMMFTDIMLAAVPMYGKFRTVESILVIAEFTMPLLAAMGLQKIFTASAEEKVRYIRPALWCIGIPAAICLLAIIFPTMFGSLISENDRIIDSYITDALMSQGYDRASVMQQFSLDSPAIYAAVSELRGSLVTADAMRSLFILLIGAVMIYLYLRGRISWVVAACGVGVIVLGDLYLVNKRYLSHDSFVPATASSVQAPVAKTPADDMILADTTANYRVMDIPRFNSAAPSYYHKTVGGYHAAKLTRYQDLIDRHLSHFLNGTESDADWNVLNMLNARYVVGHDGEPLFNPEAQGNAWLVDKVRYVDNPDDEMAALSVLDLRTEAVADKSFHDMLSDVSPAAPGDTIFETSYAPNRLTYHASLVSPAVAVFSEVYFPWGWTATVNGVPADIARVNYVLRAIKLPAGDSTVVMTFDPASLHTTDTVATVAIILIYLALVAALLMWLRRPMTKPVE
ncbi:MAG: YfhO family protein, partial [Duncaniella sp.]|nr:YfhO family protein [Duncaniella sp.]